MISELEALQRIEKPTPEERQRISELSRSARPAKTKRVRTRPAAPPISEQLDFVREKFGKPIEPWSVFECSICKQSYHLVDGAKCTCGVEESKKRYAKYLGGLHVGSR